MRDDRKDLISGQASQTLNSLLSGLSSEDGILLDQMKEEILANISQFTKMTDYMQPIKEVEGIFLKKAVHYSSADQIILKRALVAKMALHLPTILEKMDLPASILALYPNAFGRLADFLKRAGDDLPYDSTSESFGKDIRFVLAKSIPFGVQYVELASNIPLASAILSFFRSRDLSGIIRYFRAGGSGPWLRSHVDSRYITEFNEDGFIRFYLRLAETLKLHKNIKGYVGTSWFFDPQLLKVSPRLAYLQMCPLEGGAFRLQHGTQSSDIASAIKTSATRRRLYKEGKYTPTCYSMVWPRRELIGWVKQNITEKKDES